jgi:hypothetical protein
VAKIQVAFTLDYEIFGDGSGDVAREQIIPTAHLLNVLELYGARLTIFFEYGQYRAFRDYERHIPWAGAAVSKLEGQIIEAVSRGHDVQLHFHPTWSDVTLHGHSFELRADRYDLSELEPHEIRHWLQEGKADLERILCPANSSYACSCFRAGAWSLRRSEIVVPILRELGFICDSSVVPGARVSSPYGNFDYTNAPRAPFWLIGETLTEQASHGRLLEIPILARTQPLAAFRHVAFKTLMSKRITRRFYATKLTDAGKGPLEKAWKVVARDYYMADFNILSVTQLTRMIRSVAARHRDEDGVIPVVLIGHSKSSYFLDDLHLLFHALGDDPSIGFGKSLREIAEGLLARVR